MNAGSVERTGTGAYVSNFASEVGQAVANMNVLRTSFRIHNEKGN
jgi:hypothetical protein